METVRAQKHVTAFFPAIGEVNRDSIIVLMKSNASRAAMNPIGLNQPGKLVQEFSSMDTNIHRRSQLPLQHGEGQHSQHIPPPIALLKSLYRRTDRKQTTRRSQFAQGLGGVRPERHASPNFAQPISLLIHYRFNPHPTESDRRRQAPNSASDDDDLHLKVISLRAILGEAHEIIVDLMLCRLPLKVFFEPPQQADGYKFSWLIDAHSIKSD
jgi:hypothetical protein